MAPATSLARLRKRVLDLVAKRGECGGRLPPGREVPQPVLRAESVHHLRGGGPAAEAPAAARLDRRVAGPRRPGHRLRHQPPHRGTPHDRGGPGPSPLRRMVGVPRRGLQRAPADRPRPAFRPAGRRGGPGRSGGWSDHRTGPEGAPRSEVTHRHIGSDRLGEQVFLDTMYVGKLKGVGKIWQYSAVDGACSFGFATVRSGEKSAGRAGAAPLELAVVPHGHAEAGIDLEEVVVAGPGLRKGEFTGRAGAWGSRCTGSPRARRTSTPSSSGSRAPCSTCTTARPSGTGSTPRPATSTTTSRLGCVSTTSSGPTAGTGPRVVDPRRSSTPTPRAPRDERMGTR